MLEAQILAEEARNILSSTDSLLSMPAFETSTSIVPPRADARPGEGRERGRERNTGDEGRFSPRSCVLLGRKGRGVSASKRSKTTAKTTSTRRSIFEDRGASEEQDGRGGVQKRRNGGGVSPTSTQSARPRKKYPKTNRQKVRYQILPQKVQGRRRFSALPNPRSRK